MSDPRPLYIITTPKKRNDGEWNKDLGHFLLSTHEDVNVYYKDAPVVVDSWNNIKKYTNVVGAMFIFDEQKVRGSGAWVKAFYKIAKKNHWILLTATPGDKWEDYIPLFIANGFYHSKTEFRDLHIEMDPYRKFTVKAYHNTGRLLRQRKDITVRMDVIKTTIPKRQNVICKFDRVALKDVLKTRWDPFKNEPIQNGAGLTYILRRIVNSSPDRCIQLFNLTDKHPRMIVFYNYDFELEDIKEMCETYGLNYAEYNGHKHEPIPDDDEWLYLVQYSSGCEAWNCITTCVTVFYSLNYAYWIMVQAEGRIDRANTPFTYLYYYYFTSDSIVDRAIGHALNNKKDFNENEFGGKYL